MQKQKAAGLLERESRRRSASSVFKVSEQSGIRSAGFCSTDQSNGGSVFSLVSTVHVKSSLAVTRFLCLIRLQGSERILSEAETVWMLSCSSSFTSIRFITNSRIFFRKIRPCLGLSIQ